MELTELPTSYYDCIVQPNAVRLMDLIAFPPLNSFVLAVRLDAFPLAPPTFDPDNTCHVQLRTGKRLEPRL